MIDSTVGFMYNRSRAGHILLVYSPSEVSSCILCLVFLVTEAPESDSEDSNNRGCADHTSCYCPSVGVATCRGICAHGWSGAGSCGCTGNRKCGSG